MVAAARGAGTGQRQCAKRQAGRAVLGLCGIGAGVGEGVPAHWLATGSLANAATGMRLRPAAPAGAAERGPDFIANARAVIFPPDDWPRSSAGLCIPGVSPCPWAVLCALGSDDEPFTVAGPSFACCWTWHPSRSRLRRRNFYRDAASWLPRRNRCRLCRCLSPPDSVCLPCRRQPTLTIMSSIHFFEIVADPVPPRQTDSAPRLLGNAAGGRGATGCRGGATMKLN